MFEGLLTLFGRLAEQGPVMLIVEDLHWADRSTRDVLDFLARSLGPERVLIVATYRSDELHRRHPLRPWLAEMERLPRVTRLELPRLGPDDIRRQVEAITGQAADPGLMATIVRRAAGNPFFTEELLAAGATDAEDQLPGSLRDVLLVRIHGLSELGQEVIGCAAVVGPTFDHDLLLRACDLDEASVSMALREANAAQLIVVSDADGTYAFRHALLQEAIYDDMLPRDRRRCHARCAEGLAARPVPDGAEGASQLAALAHHATAAHDLPLALRGWVEAARASARVNALSEAAEAYDRALDMWDAVPADDRPAGVDVVQLMYEVSQALLGSGQLSQARQVAGEAVRRFDAAEDPLRAALLLERYARALWMTGDLTLSIAALEQAAASCRDQPATAASARVVASLAGTLMLKDLNERSVEVGREAVAMARAADAPHVEAYAICGLGTALVNRGDCAEGLPLLRQAASMAHELDIAAVDFHRTYANLSTALHNCGQLEEAVAVALEGVQWAKKRGLWRLQGSFLEANAAAALVELGRWDEARTLLDQRDRPIVEGVSLLNHAVVAGSLAVRTGRLADARALLDSARNAVANLRDAQFTGPIYGGLIELAIAEEQFDDRVAEPNLAVREHPRAGPGSTLGQAPRHDRMVQRRFALDDGAIAMRQEQGPGLVPAPELDERSRRVRLEERPLEPPQTPLLRPLHALERDRDGFLELTAVVQRGRQVGVRSMEIDGRDVELVGHRRRLTKERQPFGAVATVHKGGPEPTDGVRLDMRCVRGAGHRDGLSSDLDGPLVEVLEHERASQARHDACRCGRRRLVPTRRGRLLERGDRHRSGRRSSIARGA